MPHSYIRWATGCQLRATSLAGPLRCRSSSSPVVCACWLLILKLLPTFSFLFLAAKRRLSWRISLVPAERAELLLAGSSPAPRLGPAGCTGQHQPLLRENPHCEFLRVCFQELLKPLCKQRLTCKFATLCWSPWAAAGGDLQRC